MKYEISDMDFQLSTLHSQLSTLNPQPSTLHSQSGVELLRLRQRLGLPVAQALRLRYLFVEQDAVDLLQTLVLDAEGAHILLQLHVGPWFEGRALVQHHEVIVQREAHFRDIRAFQQADNRQCQSCLVQAEQEAVFVGRHLQQCHLVSPSLAERGPCFSVDAHDGARLQVGGRPFGFLRCLHHVYLPWKGSFGQLVQSLFINGSFYFNHNSFSCSRFFRHAEHQFSTSCSSSSSPSLACSLYFTSCRARSVFTSFCPQYRRKFSWQMASESFIVSFSPSWKTKIKSRMSW